MNKVLRIDTAEGENSFVEIGGERVVIKDDALEAIDKVFKKTQTSLKELSEIKVNRGPGSFTSLRVGLSISNTLNFALGLKGIKELDFPEYGKPPNISSPKR